MTTVFVVLNLMLMCYFAFFFLKKAKLHNKLNFLSIDWMEELPSFTYEEHRFNTRLNELIKQHNALDKLPSGYQKYKQRQKVIKEFEQLLLNHPRLKRNVPDNIINFR